MDNRYCSLFLLGVCAYAYAETPLTIETVLQKVYSTQSANGYNIPKCESDLISDQGGNPTYGEITPEGVNKLIQELNSTKELAISAADIFYDLGSGVGKMVIQMYLDTPVKESIGIELSSQRFRLAQEAKDKLRTEGLYDPKRKLQFIHHNILNVPLDTATIIFTNSLCFSDDFMQKLLKRITRLNKPVTVISTKQFPRNNYLILKRQILLPMSWSHQSPVYIYRLEKSSY